MATSRFLMRGPTFSPEGVAEIQSATIRCIQAASPNGQGILPQTGGGSTTANSLDYRPLR